MVAVGCIFAGEGEGGATRGTVTIEAASATEAVAAPTLAPELLPLVVLLFVVLVVVWLSTAESGAITAVAVPVGAVAIPALRMFWPGAMERAMPVCGPVTGMLLTVAVGCTILAMFAIGGVAQASSGKRRKIGLAFGYGQVAQHSIFGSPRRADLGRSHKSLEASQ